MRKWTQQQRANAIRDTEEMCMASDRPTAVASYNDVAIELACQRNELLEALKDILTNQVSAISGSDLTRALDAIAKAEGK